ncbi:putative exosome complex exonuclease rrp41 [Leishmania major strain Friedlin]|uniref:Putative exosome complex exonuclease rrp41 n=1 Tax=Leishmania major TaxID=5664 RepID=Q4Q1B7_LEIMA|nr:putative exosome complex exonuclease rrp41 [Leishmania major strain Friedlin]CAG9583837.1 exosome_complex_exonuclease_RRP41A [Leishmania major strain Friedlin]CAJ09264.1 putative exosome complex exonuclease rrp41 [Leishmania major strain Friedlin]|eukprot:XP_001686881.1 putative exosome complex exonuclease rrp41 [Leishmania major strain Friedlin]
MSRQKEYVSPAGLRLDGRRPLEARRMDIAFGTLSACDGSCDITLGQSKVCACVFGPRESLHKQEAKHDKGLVTCEVAVAAFAGENRRNPQRRSKLSEDIGAAVVQVARSVILLSQYPNSQIHIYIEVLQQDGNEKIACVNAACLALIDANVAMRDAVCCIDAGILDEHMLIDLTSNELRSQCPVIAAAFTGHDTRNIIWLETASRLPPDSVTRLLKCAEEGATKLFEATMRKALEEHAKKILTLQN